MKTTQFLVGLLLAIFVTTTCAIAAPLRKDERIVRDPVTGDYEIEGKLDVECLVIGAG